MCGIYDTGIFASIYMSCKLNSKIPTRDPVAGTIGTPHVTWAGELTAKVDVLLGGKGLEG